MKGNIGSNEIPWPHAPTHCLSEAGTYLVTSGTYHKQHFFRAASRLAVLQRGLLKLAARFAWRIEAWAVFSNHYHFVAHSPETGAESLREMLTILHRETGIWVNKLDKSPARTVWYNYRETRLTYQNSYLARLNYVHQNPVKHGLVPLASQYPWCSAAWFERVATRRRLRQSTASRQTHSPCSMNMIPMGIGADMECAVCSALWLGFPSRSVRASQSAEQTAHSK